MANPEVFITYKNWRGETRERRVAPIDLNLGKTEWHPELQWFLFAYDIEKGETRMFAMKDISNWRQVKDLPGAKDKSHG